jgi:hypothetical protein
MSVYIEFADEAERRRRRLARRQMWFAVGQDVKRHKAFYTVLAVLVFAPIVTLVVLGMSGNW